jgi:hypothetical protein
MARDVPRPPPRAEAISFLHSPLVPALVCRAAGPLQTAALRAQAAGVDSHAAGVITPVLQPLQTLHQHRDDIAGGNPADDAAHSFSLNPMEVMLKALVKN